MIKFKFPRYCPMLGIYLLIVFLSLIFVNFEGVWNHMVPSVLSRYMPVKESWDDFARDGHAIENKKMREFERYYFKVAQFMPFLPEANAMLGYCYFYDHQIGKSKKAYEKAIAGYSRVFNFHYNLGIISLKQNNLHEALDHFKKSVAVSPVENIRYIVSARIYQPFLPFMREPQALGLALGQHASVYYREAYLRILEISQTIKDYKTMYSYARAAMAGGILDKSTGLFYAGSAGYHLKDYESATLYLQEAVKGGFYFSQAFDLLGFCLEAMQKPQSAQAFAAARNLRKEGKVFKAEEFKEDLIFY